MNPEEIKIINRGFLYLYYASLLTRNKAFYLSKNIFQYINKNIKPKLKEGKPKKWKS